MSLDDWSEDDEPLFCADCGSTNATAHGPIELCRGCIDRRANDEDLGPLLEASIEEAKAAKCK